MEFADVMTHFNKVCHSYRTSPDWEREGCNECSFFNNDICESMNEMGTIDKEKQIDPDFWRNVEKQIMAAQPSKAAEVTLRDLIQLFLVEYDLDDIVQNPNFDIKRSK